MNLICSENYTLYYKLLIYIQQFHVFLSYG
jgi:hypothetical protein